MFIFRLRVKQAYQKTSCTRNMNEKVNDDDNKDNDRNSDHDKDSDSAKDSVIDMCESDSCYGTDSDCESADSQSEMDVSDSGQDCVSSDGLGMDCECDCSDYSAISLYDSALVTDGCSSELSSFRSRIPVRKSSVILASVKSATSTQPTSFTSRIPVRKTKQKVKQVTTTMKQKVKNVIVIRTTKLVEGRKKKIATKTGKIHSRPAWKY